MAGMNIDTHDTAFKAPPLEIDHCLANVAVLERMLKYNGLVMQ